MAYQVSSIASMAAIPRLVGTFAAGQGWTVDNGDRDRPILQRAGAAGGLRFRFYHNKSKALEELVFCSRQDTDHAVWIMAPRLNGTPGYLVRPTELHLTGQATPVPWLAVSVAFGFNLYRHIYLGHFETRFGGFTGGEIVSAANFWSGNDPGYRTTVDAWDRSTQRLFSCEQNVTSVNQAGGVHVPHSNNPRAWRHFKRTKTGNDSYNTSLDNSIVLGGARDGINEGYIGRSPYAGANILAPVNLYAGLNTRIVPLGAPAGVRMVDMQDIEPGAEIRVGGQPWRCFPSLSKQSWKKVRFGSWRSTLRPTAWPTAESSHYLGYAFQAG